MKSSVNLKRLRITAFLILPSELVVLSLVQLCDGVRVVVGGDGRDVQAEVNYILMGIVHKS